MSRTGIYPGSFDPIHKGHIDIINRATKLVDKLYIAVADSPHKSPLFDLDERKEMIENEFSSNDKIEVIAFDNLLIDLANSLDAKILIRGLRVVSDFEYEFQMLGMNRQLDNNIETVFLMADAQRQSISSNFVKEIARLGGNISNFTNKFSFFIALIAEGVVMANDPENSIQIELKDGNVIIELLPDIAPNHVNRIKELAREGFYDGVPFHRVIEGFMAQTGDGENRNGTGGSTKPDLKNEFGDTPHLRGTVSMARTADPDSANSQFFICFAEAPHLDGQYTVFGQVVEGMEFVDKIKRGEPGSGSVDDPDEMITVRVISDL